MPTERSIVLFQKKELCLLYSSCLFGSDLSIALSLTVLQILTDFRQTSRHMGDDPELHAKALRLDPTGARILFAPVQALPMASSDIRTRLTAGEGCEAELPEAVRAVIRREKLYKKEVSANEPQTGKGACARPLER